MKLRTSFDLHMLLSLACQLHSSKPDNNVMRRLQAIREASRTTIINGAPPPIIHSAVLILVCADSILFTVRSAQLRNDPGAVVFPGGKRDPEDRDAVATALREAWEEIGATISEEAVVGLLPTVCRIDAATLATITPIVAYVDRIPKLALNPNEVASAHALPHGTWLNAETLAAKSSPVQPELIEIGSKGIRGSTYFILEMLRQSIAEVLRVERRWRFPLERMVCRGATSDSESFRRLDLRREVEVPIGPHVGAFLKTRRHHVHEGIDLYCPVGTSVIAAEPGEVVGIIPFTGPKADSPWWNDTEAVMVKGESGIVVYGEISADRQLREGDKVEAGDHLGRVLEVLRHDKGRPRSMLHLELRDPTLLRVTTPRGDWPLETAHDPSKYVLLSKVI